MEYCAYRSTFCPYIVDGKCTRPEGQICTYYDDESDFGDFDEEY